MPRILIEPSYKIRKVKGEAQYRAVLLRSGIMVFGDTPKQAVERLFDLLKADHVKWVNEIYNINNKDASK